MADEVVEEFLVESREGLERIERDLIELEEDPGRPGVVDRVFRDIHTIKGVCGFLGYTHLEGVTHAGESLLSKLRAGELAVTEDVITALLATVDAVRSMLEQVERTGADGDDPHEALVASLRALHEQDAPPPAPVDPAAPEPEASDLAQQGSGADERRAAPSGTKDTTIRVHVDLLDKLMNLVGELVLVRNQILRSTLASEDAVSSNAQRLNLVTTELQEGVMKTRMQPIGTIWKKLPRVVRDLATACGKRMRLEMEGKETELDKTVIEAIKDPLTHLVRNACDHGMEPPAERRAAGKPEEGVLRLRASHEGGLVIIEVTDDGRGIDPEKVKQRALDRGLITAAQASRLGDREALQLICLPGFSTAEKVTNVSGRGVGMDVVKTNIERLGGTIELRSRLGEGTTFRVKIPLTLAIIPALIVDCAGERYAIPQVDVVELVLLEGADTRRVERIDGAPVYRMRGKLLPLVFLSEQLGLEGTAEGADELQIIVLQADGRELGLVVDSVQDTEEIVVKPLGEELDTLGVYAGATIMGDGSVALILDVLGLAQAAALGSETGHEPLADDGEPHPDRALAHGETLLLFETPGDAPAAVPLARVERLEELEASRLERVGGRDVVQYRGRIMPLAHVDHAVDGIPLDRARREPGRMHQVVVVRRGDVLVGLVVRRLLDIVDVRFELRPVGRRPGVLGSCVVQGRVVELLDVDALVAGVAPHAGEDAALAEGA
jgi:two-component system chemotaxis sensor kinase CheA